MELLIAKSSGFCRGVKNAVDTALNISPENTYIYGEIIHNKETVERIEKRGIKTVASLDEVPKGATLIIRSHGVGKDVFSEAEKRGIKTVNCTCQFVQRTQKIVDNAHKDGKTVVIIGEKSHPEVVGLNGWCENSAYVFSSENDDFSVLQGDKLCIVAQTTFSNEKFEKIVKIIQNTYPKTVEVFATICYTTIERQKEADELSKVCDAMLVIGGANSSNTNKLFDISKNNCKNVFRLHSSKEIDFNKLKDFNKVGIVMGASTPNLETQEVLEKYGNRSKSNDG